MLCTLNFMKRDLIVLCLSWFMFLSSSVISKNIINEQTEIINNLKDQQAQKVSENLDLLAENEDLKEEVSALNKQIEELEKELAEQPQ